MKKFLLVMFLLSVPLFSRAQLWLPLGSSFLEPNRLFSVYDADASRLVLGAGYGQSFLRTPPVFVGAEMFIWSGLKTLPGFRFPVETADYFFGLYATLPIVQGNPALASRIRLSHISSHLVDGTEDSVVGGASSRFSREFISYEMQYALPLSFFLVRGMFGAKYVFHQVTQVEPTVQPIIALEIVPLVWWYDKGSPNKMYKGEVFVGFSYNTGPLAARLTGSLTLRLKPGTLEAIDIFGAYHSGKSLYGIDGPLQRDGWEAGMRLGFAGL